MAVQVPTVRTQHRVPARRRLRALPTVGHSATVKITAPKPIQFVLSP